MQWNHSDDKSKYVQVMTWGHQATHHYLNKYSLISTLPYGLIRPQWVNSSIGFNACLGYYIHENIGMKCHNFQILISLVVSVEFRKWLTTFLWNDKCNYLLISYPQSNNHNKWDSLVFHDHVWPKSMFCFPWWCISTGCICWCTTLKCKCLFTSLQNQLSFTIKSVRTPFWHCTDRINKRYIKDTIL